MIKKNEQLRGDDKSLQIDVEEVNRVEGESSNNKKATEGGVRIEIDITTEIKNERPETQASPSVSALWHAFHLWLMSKFEA